MEKKALSRQEVFMQRLDDVLKSKGISRRQLSINTGIAESTMSRWKKSFPKKDTISLLCEVLDLPEGYFDIVSDEDNAGLILHSREQVHEDYMLDAFNKLSINQKLEVEVISQTEPEAYALITFLKTMGYSFVYEPERLSSASIILDKKVRELSKKEKANLEALEKEYKSIIDRIKEKDYEALEWEIVDAIMSNHDKYDGYSDGTIKDALLNLRVYRLNVYLNSFIKQLENVLYNNADAYYVISTENDKEVIKRALYLLNNAARSECAYFIQRALDELSGMEDVSLMAELDELIKDIEVIDSEGAVEYVKELQENYNQGKDLHFRMRLVGEYIELLRPHISSLDADGLSRSYNAIKRKNIHRISHERRRQFNNILTSRTITDDIKLIDNEIGNLQIKMKLTVTEDGVLVKKELIESLRDIIISPRITGLAKKWISLSNEKNVDANALINPLLIDEEMKALQQRIEDIDIAMAEINLTTQGINDTRKVSKVRSREEIKESQERALREAPESFKWNIKVYRFDELACEIGFKELYNLYKQIVQKTEESLS